MSLLKKWLIAGLLVWVPLGATILIIRFMVELLDRSLLLLPYAWRPEALLGFSIPGLGLLLCLIVLLVTGFFAANLLGQTLMRVSEYLLDRIPLVRSIYAGTKRIAETVLSGGGDSFRKVVLVEYPRREIWTLAFLTGTPVGEVQEKTRGDVVTVYVPTTPNPTSGFVVMMPRDDIIELDMSVEDGLQLIISMGVVSPDAPGKKDEKSTSDG